MPQVIARVHSDHTMTQCTAPGGRPLDGDSLGHTPIKSACARLLEALRHYHHLVLSQNLKACTHFAVARRVVCRVDSDTAGKGAAARAQRQRPQRV